MNVREVVRLIEADGWSLVARRGSHRQFKDPRKPARVTDGWVEQRETHRFAGWRVSLRSTHHTVNGPFAPSPPCSITTLTSRNFASRKFGFDEFMDVYFLPHRGRPGVRHRAARPGRIPAETSRARPE